MPDSLTTFLECLPRDPWRAEVGFSDEISLANSQLMEASGKPNEQAGILNDWIISHQPCLFGKTAAKQGALSFCVISEADIAKGDEFVRQQIENSHLEWTRAGVEGRSSGFILAIISERISHAIPGAEMLAFARRLGRLYLVEEDDLALDKIYHDQIFLEAPEFRRTTWKWKAGVNYFAAHGDKRWWQDHRIPGGMAFSTNSVGHLAKSGLLAAILEEMKSLGVPPDDRPAVRVASLERALQVAMQTIDNASATISGAATQLLPLPTDLGTLPVSKCPYTLPNSLAEKNFCHYRGYYHTDFTLPSEYFRPEVERPPETQGFDNLDFTYLFNASQDNPAFFSMGRGIPIRANDLDDDQASSWNDKHARFAGVEVFPDSEPQLMRALQLRRPG